MTKPSDIPFLNFIILDKTSTLALYRQIAEGIILAIAQANIIVGHPLPSSRELSKILGVNRNTVVSAFEELNALGWIITKPNQGSFVARTSLSNALKTKVANKNTPDKKNKFAGFQFEKTNILDNPYTKISTAFYFSDGTPDYRLSLLKDLNSNYNTALKRGITQSNQSKDAFHNSEYLLENIANYLNISRALDVDKDNLLLCRSSQMGLFLCTQILLSPAQYAIVPDLNHFNINMNFTKAKATIVTVPYNQQGPCLESIENLCKKYPIRLVYLSPHHHYPTTNCQSPQSRKALLQLAHKYGFIILEDDYQYDFCYDKHPVLPMTSKDDQGMCIYSGTLGSALPIGFNLGYVVGPADFIIELKKYQQLIDPATDMAMQQVIAQLISEGEYFRIQKKSTAIYQQRRDYFCRLLNEFFNNKIQFQIPQAGLAIWVEFTPKINIMRLKTHAKTLGLTLPHTLLYQNKDLCAMRLGFAHLNAQEMLASVDLLHKAYLLTSNSLDL